MQCKIFINHLILINFYVRNTINELFILKLYIQKSEHMANNTQLIKLDLEHNLSSLKIPQLKVDPNQTVLALKQNIERRYGSEPNYVRLVLKTKKGEIVSQMDQQMRTLNFYGASSGMIVQVLDLNPNSIHKEIENVGQVQKYVMSEETYDKLPENFRKWKTKFIEQHPEVKGANGKVQICDSDYLESMAQDLSVGMRCQMENGARGQIRFIGKVPEIGVGYFVGILLDEESEWAIGGILAGNYYFYSEPNRGTFARPNKIEVGEFPKIEQEDQI